MKLPELVEEVKRLQHAAPGRELMNDLVDRLTLAAKALGDLRDEGPKTEAQMASYLTAVEMLIRNTLRRAEGSR